VKRRNFLGSLALGSSALAVGFGLSKNQPISTRSNIPLGPILEDAPATALEMANAAEKVLTPPPLKSEYLESFTQHLADSPKDPEQELARYLEKMQNFELSHQEDVFLAPEQKTLLVSSFQRIDRVQTLVGHGNFNVIGFDAMLNYARQHSSVGAFTREELDFLESVFFDDVERYGFFGEKVIDSLTAVVNERDRVKVSHTGHFLFRGDSLQVYEKIRRDVGENVILTSGIRGIVKQTHLFLAKTIQAEGNLSLASRSLAPPGHSFHGIGDFDVGKVGFGAKNFTAQFAHTDEYRTLVELGYLDMRYPEQNLFGVRFEPWHIKVA
jgi:hypothetical protein